MVLVNIKTATKNILENIQRKKGESQNSTVEISQAKDKAVLGIYMNEN